MTHEPRPSEIPENQPMLTDIFRIFLRGHWSKMGITGEQEDTLAAEMRRDNRLTLEAAQVWEAHKDRILTEWLDRLDRLALYPEPCQTCPNCGCPGMG